MTQFIDLQPVEVIPNTTEDHFGYRLRKIVLLSSETNQLCVLSLKNTQLVTVPEEEGEQSIVQEIPFRNPSTGEIEPIEILLSAVRTQDQVKYVCDMEENSEWDLFDAEVEVVDAEGCVVCDQAYASLIDSETEQDYLDDFRPVLGYRIDKVIVENTRGIRHIIHVLNGSDCLVDEFNKDEEREIEQAVTFFHDDKIVTTSVNLTTQYEEGKGVQFKLSSIRNRDWYVIAARVGRVRRLDYTEEVKALLIEEQLENSLELGTIRPQYLH